MTVMPWNDSKLLLQKGSITSVPAMQSYLNWSILMKAWENVLKVFLA